jgi:hypothetical protein
MTNISNANVLVIVPAFNEEGSIAEVLVGSEVFWLQGFGGERWIERRNTCDIARSSEVSAS